MTDEEMLLELFGPFENHKQVEPYCPVCFVYALHNNLQEARRQLAEKDKEIERLSNPGRTQFCRMCQDYAEQIERLTAYINGRITLLDSVKDAEIERLKAQRRKDFEAGIMTAYSKAISDTWLCEHQDLTCSELRDKIWNDYIKGEK